MTVLCKGGLPDSHPGLFQCRTYLSEILHKLTGNIKRAVMTEIITEKKPEVVGVQTRHSNKHLFLPVTY